MVPSGAEWLENIPFPVLILTCLYDYSVGTVSRSKLRDTLASTKLL